MDNLTKEQRHKNMKKIHSKDTSIELKLRKALWKNGIRYRKNVNKLLVLCQDLVQIKMRSSAC